MGDHDGLADTLAEHQPLVSGGSNAEMVALHHLSGTPLTPIPLAQPGTPVPVGLSDKEIAPPTYLLPHDPFRLGPLYMAKRLHTQIPPLRRRRSVTSWTS
jgi:hypothetical protein